jgi:hypothetical protein
MEKWPHWMEDIKVNIDIVMSNPPGSVLNGTIIRGYRWQRVVIIYPNLLFACTFTSSRDTDEASTLTGIAWYYTFAANFPCMTSAACLELSRRRRVLLRVVSPDMASQKITD